MSISGINMHAKKITLKYYDVLCSVGDMSDWESSSSGKYKSIGNIDHMDLALISRIIGNNRKCIPDLVSFGATSQVTQSREERFVHSIFESCVFKSIASCIMGV